NSYLTGISQWASSVLGAGDDLYQWPLTRSYLLSTPTYFQDGFDFDSIQGDDSSDDARATEELRTEPGGSSGVLFEVDGPSPDGVRFQSPALADSLRRDSPRGGEHSGEFLRRSSRDHDVVQSGDDRHPAATGPGDVADDGGRARLLGDGQQSQRVGDVVGGGDRPRTSQRQDLGARGGGVPATGGPGPE